MISLIIFFGVLLQASAFPQDPQQVAGTPPSNLQAQPLSAEPLEHHPTPISIINHSESFGENGAYNFSYETSNGIKVEEAAFLKHVTGIRARLDTTDPDQPDEDDILVRTGSYTYTSPDGTPITLEYVADENGFQPMGAHLPTPPPLPTGFWKQQPSQQPQQPQEPQQIQPTQQPQPQQPESSQQPHQQEETTTQSHLGAVLSSTPETTEDP